MRSMGNQNSDYRLSTRAVLAIGSVCVVLGLVAWIAGSAAGPVVGVIGFVVFVLGVPVLVSGLIRESRENKTKRAARQ